jgi:hypothetical protein
MQKSPTWPMHVGDFCYILSPSRLTTGRRAWGVIKRGTTSMSEQVTVKQKEQVRAGLAHGSILLASLGIR